MAKKPVESTYEEEPRVIVKKKGGWLGKIIALLLGFVMGIGATAHSSSRDIQPLENRSSLAT